MVVYETAENKAEPKKALNHVISGDNIKDGSLYKNNFQNTYMSVGFVNGDTVKTTTLPNLADWTMSSYYISKDDGIGHYVDINRNSDTNVITVTMSPAATDDMYVAIWLVRRYEG